MVIADGEVVRASMEQLGITSDWLGKVLEQKKLRRQDIFLMTVDGSRKVFIVEKEAEGQKK